MREHAYGAAEPWPLHLQPSLTCLRLFACAQDKFNFTSPSKMRAGQLLGRCHAALGQQSLSATAFDAAIGLAQTTRFLLQVRELSSHIQLTAA